MKFPAFEWIRISRKWNIPAARELWGLGRFQLRWSMGRMECCKMDVSHVANHSRPTSCLAHIIFIFFFSYNIWFINSARSSSTIVSACFRIIILNLPCFVGIHVGLSEHEPWTLPRFPAEFFPYWVFFRQVFLASVLTVFFVNCLSARLFYFTRHMFECSITSCYISRCLTCDQAFFFFQGRTRRDAKRDNRERAWSRATRCSGDTVKINLMVSRFMLYCVVEPKYL